MTPFNLAEQMRLAHVRLSEGMMPGGYEELAQKYPEKIVEIDEELHNNFTEGGIKNYEARMTKGLKAINMWKG